VRPMSEVSRILSAVEEGDPHAAEQLLPLVYDELRQLAAEKLAHEQPGQTLQATALVHEAYLRLLGAKQTLDWDDRRTAESRLRRRYDQITTGANTSAMRAGFWMPCCLIQESALSICARPSSPPRISPRRRRDAAA
jgi:hypothetical protein